MGNASTMQNKAIINTNLKLGTRNVNVENAKSNKNF